MKAVWECRWEAIPGSGEQKEQFSTLAAAKHAMRRKIAESVNLEECLKNFEPQVAKFLHNYLTDPCFPRSKEDIPAEYEDPEDGYLFLDSDYIRMEYPCDAFPKLNTNIVLDDAPDAEYSFNFWYESPEEATGNGVKELCITISHRIVYGSSAYLPMVLFALREYPQTQDQIIRTIWETWDTLLNRKAVGRHLQFLQDFGIPVKRCLEGYYYEGTPGKPNAGITFTPSTYPLLILEVLDSTPKTQTAIIHAVQEKYATKIDRKAVARHLELLKALGFVLLQKNKEGYYLGK